MITNALKTTSNNQSLNDFSATDIGDDHLFTGLETPMKADAFKLSDSEKKERIAILFEEIMDVMGLDLTDDSLQGTPKRVAKMYIDEIFFWFESCQQTKNSIV
jgi:GTP cyclohydrolase I